MAKSDTSFNKDNQPKGRKPRGKSERTKILEAMERKSKTEDGFYELLVEKAHNPEDQFSFGELLKRLSPISKSVAPMIKFEMPANAKPHEKASYVIHAIADGKIPADLGGIVISGITSMLKIQELTDFDDRLKAIEKKQNEPD